MTTVYFSDLDGTLLDHESYSFDPARPALDALRRAGVPVVLATSKTAAELRSLRAALSLQDHPAIVENGAGIVWPGAAAADGFDDSAYRRVRTTLLALPKDLRAPFEGFGDLDAAGVAALTGLSLEDAAAARQRNFSEPGRWRGDEATRARFCAALLKNGVHARMGGRFLTLSEGRTKADAMREVAQKLGATQMVALGDAPNDIEMLETADLGVIVRNPASPALPPLAGEAAGRIRRTTLDGPSGWNRAVLDILTETATAPGITT